VITSTTQVTRARGVLIGTLAAAAAAVALTGCAGPGGQHAGAADSTAPVAATPSRPATVAATPSRPATGASAGTTGRSGPSVSVNAGVPAGSVAGLSGSLYYWGPPDRLVRLTSSGMVRALDTGARNANVSPDGRSIAFIDHASDVLVADRDGGHARTVLRGSVGAGFEPVWSPDSTRLLAVRAGTGGAPVPGVVDVRTGGFTPLAHNPGGAHYLWSADGRHLGYNTGTCQIGVADADGRNARLVPVLGDRNSSVNPDRKRSCRPFSISADGSRIAVDLQAGNTPDGDAGRRLFANAVIDTRTGATVRLPVPGAVSAVLFQPNGGTLVRSGSAGHNLLTLLSPDGTVITQVTEPATANNLALLAYTTT
jgi:TolB protein